MNCKTNIACIACLFIAPIVVSSGCRQATVVSPAVTSQTEPDETVTPVPDENTSSDAAAVPDNAAPDNAVPDNAAVKDQATAPDEKGPVTTIDGKVAAANVGTSKAATDDPPSATEDPAASDTTANSQTAESGVAEIGDAADDTDAPTSADIATADLAGTETLDGPPTERFALLAPGGPLIVDVIITIDGDAHSSALADLVDEAFEAADTDGDGERTWDEVANSPKFMYGQFGNLPVNSDAEKSQLITMYDRNEDGLVDRAELPRFVTRNVGRAQSFSLRSSNEFRTANRTRSPFRRLLDADHDGAITQEEMVAAPARLLSRDADDDQIITLADFKDGAQQTPGTMSNRRRTTEPDTAILINARTKWAYASFALQELYSFGDSVRANDWPLTSELFATLDADGDGELDRTEVEQLATVKPHMRLLARFGVKNDDNEDETRETTLALDFVDPSIEAAVTAVRTHRRRVSIELSRVEIEFFVNEDPSLSNYEQVAMGQFNALDTDSNGYLEMDEIPEQLPGFDVPFAGVDADDDGKVYLEELASFLALRQRAYRGQVRARAADQEDALFTALDTTGDGRLHAREIAAAPAVLAKMDLNQDGDLQSPEIPGSMVVGFVRGNPQQDNTLFVMPTGTSDVGNDRLPRWFLGMDTNRDGEVGFHEFMGTSERFAKFDKDGDSFISPSELPSEMLKQPETNAAEADTDSPAADAEPESPAADAVTS